MIVIPARGGSKGVPGKNIKMLRGIPLIQYTIEVAREIASDQQILVSTDSPEIKEVVESLGLRVPFLRPPHLATDTAGTYEVLLHALDFYENKISIPQSLLVLQPTSPFRNAEQVKSALELYDENLDMIASVKETTSNPYYVLREENEQGFLIPSKEGKFKRRQDCPKVWELNGAIYVINPKSLKENRISDFTRVKKYEMDELSSHDIDTALDWKIAEVIAKDFFS